MPCLTKAFGIDAKSDIAEFASFSAMMLTVRVSGCPNLYTSPKQKQLRAIRCTRIVRHCRLSTTETLGKSDDLHHRLYVELNQALNAQTYQAVFRHALTQWGVHHRAQLLFGHLM